MCPDKHKFLHVVFVVEVISHFFNIFHTFHSMLAKLELQEKINKKPKATRKKFQGNKIQQNKIKEIPPPI